MINRAGDVDDLFLVTGLAMSRAYSPWSPWWWTRTPLHLRDLDKFWTDWIRALICKRCRLASHKPIWPIAEQILCRDLRIEASCVKSFITSREGHGICVDQPCGL